MRTLQGKTPINHRPLIVGVLLLLPMVASAQVESWTADDAVTRALSRPEMTAIREAGQRQVRAEMGEVTVRPAPTIGLAHEDGGRNDGAPAREVSAILEQPLDFVPWRGRLRESFRHRESAFLAADDDRRLEIASLVRSAFYGVLYHDLRVAALGRWVGRLRDGHEALVAREQRGDVSSYELHRVERELDMARAERAREESRLAETWVELRTWCLWQERPTLVGDLAPTTPQAAEDDAPLPHLARLDELGRSLDAEIRAWGTPFLRNWVLGAGYRYAEADSEIERGVLLTLSVPLPLWNTTAPRQDRLRAERVRIESDLVVERQRASDAAEAAADRFERLLDALRGLPPAERDAKLTGQAELAYAAGEATLTELLDAYESEVEFELARTDLQWEARRASIELDRRRGMGVPR